MKFHPFAEVFPQLDGEEQTALIADIEANGLREPIWKYKNKILDGRNRFLACQHAGVKPRYRPFKGNDDDAIAFVVSMNLQRRHLTIEQRALAAARVATLGHGVRSDSSDAPRGASTQTEAADKMGVGRRSVQRARKIVEKGSKALQRAVSAGEVPLTKAVSVVDLPKSEQLGAATGKNQRSETDEGWTPDEDEGEKLALAERELNASIDKIFEADDRLAAARDEIKRQAAEIATLKISRDGYMNGKAAVTKLLKKEQRVTEQLSKKLDKANAEIEKLRERIAIMEN